MENQLRKSKKKNSNKRNVIPPPDSLVPEAIGKKRGCQREPAPSSFSETWQHQDSKRLTSSGFLHITYK